MTTRKPFNTKRLVAISGGFDPIHIGHIRLIQEAAALGGELVVILNNDNWLRAKKGFVFMPQAERKELLKAVRGVARVVLSKHSKQPADMSVAAELERIHPDIFANGGDRGRSNTPENLVCRKLGIKQAFNIGKGGKVQSSSWLIAKSATKSPKQ